MSTLMFLLRMFLYSSSFPLCRTTSESIAMQNVSLPFGKPALPTDISHVPPFSPPSSGCFTQPPQEPTPLPSFAHEWCPVLTWEVLTALQQSSNCIPSTTELIIWATENMGFGVFPFSGNWNCWMLQPPFSSLKKGPRNAMMRFWVPSPTQRKLSPMCLP